jgi:subtilisin family serine protease
MAAKARTKSKAKSKAKATARGHAAMPRPKVLVAARGVAAPAVVTMRKSGRGTPAAKPRSEPPKAPRHAAFVPGKLHIRFKADALHGAAAAMERGVRAPRSLRASDPRVRELRAAIPAQVVDPLRLLAQQFGVREIKPLIVPATEQRQVARVARPMRSVASLAASVRSAPRTGLGGYCVVELEQERDVPPQVLERIRASPAVDYVERVANRWTSARTGEPDPSLNLQWGLRAIEWFQAARPDARGVHVAVLDSGIDANHPDLDGIVAAYHHDGLSARDFEGHGTHVAGIVAARTNNGVGIAGVANCRLHVWKVFGDPVAGDTKAPFDDEAYNQALAAVLDSPARIVNLSLGGSERSRVEQDLIAALVAEGALVVAAMGNDYEEGNPTEWPAAYANVLAVGAIGENRRRASFSNTGRHINLMAPGNAILSTLPRYASLVRDETDYAAWPGTSMAAPHVAGVAALLKARHPQRDGPWIARRLQDTATRLAAMRGKSFTSGYGHGLLNVRRALAAGR